MILNDNINIYWLILSQKLTVVTRQLQYRKCSAVLQIILLSVCQTSLPDPAEVHHHLCPHLLLRRAGGANLLVGGHLGGRGG